MSTSRYRQSTYFKLSSAIESGILICLVAYFLSRFIPTARVRHIVTFIGFALIAVSIVGKAVRVRFARVDLFLLIVLAGILLCGVVSAGVGDIDLVYRSLAFFLLMVLFALSGTPVTIKLSARYLSKVVIIITAVSLALSFSGIAYYGEGGRAFNSLTIGMTNPNLTGMVFAGCIYLLVIVLPSVKHKIITALAIVVLLFLLWRTDARSCLVVTLLYLLFAALYSRKRIPKIALWAAILAPIIFGPLYFWASETFSQILVLGKPLFSGREAAFATSLSALDSPTHILFGNLADQRFDNAHNSFITILANTGVVGVFISELIMLRNTLKLGSSQQSITARLGLLSLAAVFVQSLAEFGFFAGVFPTAVFMYYFILIGNGSLELESCDS